jgi:ribulose-5-phosphate 4-epimerase/fuculose-1-phosphate aldolase
MSVAASLTRTDPVEARLRRDLAAAYRLVALFGWDDLVATHISVRLPDHKGFLINPFGMLFDEIRPADLVKVDMDGNLLEPTPWQVNQAGFVIHSAIHQARTDALCVMHLHTTDGVAVSCIEEGLLPLNQTSMFVARAIAYHEFEGVALNLEERERLAADLGDKTLMILRNHGTLSVGQGVGDAFYMMYMLETACTIQVKALSQGRKIHQASAAAFDQVAGVQANMSAGFADLAWDALLRKLDRAAPGWDA